jgi:hypothetical protein
MDENDDPVPVLVEPLPGHTDEEIAAALEGCGAHEVNVLAPGFISAQTPRSSLEMLATIAHVHPKRTKQMHDR